MKKNILILGGGYGGLLSALTVRQYVTEAEASVTLVNRYPTHQIITELHRLAAGNVTEEAVTLPLEKLLKNKNVSLRIDNVEHIAPDKKTVQLSGGGYLNYDLLVIALGSETAYFGIPGLKENSLILKSAQDANQIREHVKSRLKAYAKTKNKADATIIVGGGGLTGVELVGEFADELPAYCRENAIPPSDIELYCVEAGPSILNGFPQALIDRAKSSLEKRGVKFLTGTPITEVKGNQVFLKDGSSIEAGTFVWSGGVQGHSAVMDCGIEVNRGRATVTPHLQSTSHSDIFLAGDSAVVFNSEGRPYPPTAQLAWQMGELVGYNLFATLRGMPLKEFEPIFSGTLASLGRKDGIATVGASQTQLKGFPASAMKEASHIRYLSHIKGLFALAH